MPVMIKYAMQKRAISQDAKSALIGALVGGGLGGVSSFITPTDDDESRVRKILSHVLAGAAMGGMAGYGVRRLNENTGVVDSIVDAVDPDASSSNADSKPLPYRDIIRAGGVLGGGTLAYGGAANAVRRHRVGKHMGNFESPDLSNRPIFNGADYTFNESSLKALDKDGKLIDSAVHGRGADTVERSIANANAKNGLMSIPGRARNRLLSSEWAQWVAKSKAGTYTGSFRDWLAKSRLARGRFGRFSHLGGIRNVHLVGDKGIESLLADLRLNRDLVVDTTGYSAAITNLENALAGRLPAGERAKAVREARRLLRESGNARKMIRSGRNLARAGGKLPRALRALAILSTIAGAGAFAVGDEK